MTFIKFDKRYGDIFTYLLGRVAVVGTMDDAVSLSKKTGSSVRFVTLEGEVVNASGAMTGGRYKNNTANLLERKRNKYAGVKDRGSESPCGRGRKRG